MALMQALPCAARWVEKMGWSQKMAETSLTCYNDRMKVETYYSIWWNVLLVATAAVGSGAKRMQDWSFQGSVDLHKPSRMYMPASEVAAVIP
jgi:hypothetical protein